jgi:membrane fusion protein, multidrug efflux system
MKVIHRTIAGVAAAGLVMLATVGCSGGEAREVGESSAATGRVVSVEVLEVRPESFVDFVAVVGTVEPNRDVTISAEESGTIRQLLVDKGAFVQAGQPIARIDDRVLRPQAEQAASEAALAQETYERQRRLWEEDGVGTEMAYLRARYAAQTADAGARVLRERLERSVVRAPIAGILDSRSVEVGTLVAPGTPIARVIDAATVKISGGVPERFAGQIQRGTPVEVAFDGMRGAVTSGTVGFVGATVDASSRTFLIEVLVPNPRYELKPGLIANVRLARETINEALVVPQEAVLRVEDGYIVYLVAEAGGEQVAEARVVTLGASQGNRVIVTSGLQAGDRVVVVGQNRLANGDRVLLVDPIAGRVR